MRGQTLLYQLDIGGRKLRLSDIKHRPFNFNLVVVLVSRADRLVVLSVCIDDAALALVSAGLR